MFATDAWHRHDYYCLKQALSGVLDVENFKFFFIKQNSNIFLQAKMGDSISCTSLSISVMNSTVISKSPLKTENLFEIEKKLI